MSIIKSIVIRLSDEIHQQLKIQTAKDNISIQQLIETFVKEYVESSKDNK